MHRIEEKNMRRSRIHTLIGSLVCGALFSMVTPPAGAQTSQPDLKKMSSSTVAADHRALAARYRAHAAEHEADAARHDALVADLKARTADDETWDLARDAAHYAQHSREAAEALSDLAALHEAAADRLGPPDGEKTPSAGGCCGKGMAGKHSGMAGKAHVTADKNAEKSAEPNHSEH
jgi:hypothetical protein